MHIYFSKFQFWCQCNVKIRLLYTYPLIRTFWVVFESQQLNIQLMLFPMRFTFDLQLLNMYLVRKYSMLTMILRSVRSSGWFLPDSWLGWASDKPDRRHQSIKHTFSKREWSQSFAEPVTQLRNWIWSCFGFNFARCAAFVLACSGWVKNAAHHAQLVPRW